MILKFFENLAGRRNIVLTVLALPLAATPDHDVRRKRVVSLYLTGLGQLHALDHALLSLELGHDGFSP